VDVWPEQAFGSDENVINCSDLLCRSDDQNRQGSRGAC